MFRDCKESRFRRAVRKPTIVMYIIRCNFIFVFICRILFLKSISIGNRRNTRQYCYFLDDSLSFLLPGISMINTFVEIIVVYVVSIFVFAVNDVRIHGICMHCRY